MQTVQFLAHPTFLSFQSTGTELPSCQSLGVALIPNTSTSAGQPTPPFYMLGHEVGGTSRLTYIGDNPNSLTWTVDHPVGAHAYSLFDSLNPNVISM
jgi:hypothetical protein